MNDFNKLDDIDLKELFKTIKKKISYIDRLLSIIIQI